MAKTPCPDCGTLKEKRSVRCRKCSFALKPGGRKNGPEKPPHVCECGNPIRNPKAKTCKPCCYKTRTKKSACSKCGKAQHIIANGLCADCRFACPSCGKPRVYSASGLANPDRPCRACIREKKKAEGYEPAHKLHFCECGERRSVGARHCKACHLRDHAKPGVGVRVHKQSVGEYVYVPAPPGHPAATRSGRIAEHRLVMEQHLGRYLKTHEHVHHRSGFRSQNDIANLELWTVSHPCGQRVEEKAAWAIGFLRDLGYTVSRPVVWALEAA